MLHSSKLVLLNVEEEISWHQLLNNLYIAGSLLVHCLYAACTMYTACILLVYCLYIPCMLLVHCTQLVYCLHTTCMLLVHSTRLVYFLYNVHCLYTTCILLAATSLPHCTVLICGIASSLPAQNCLFEHSVFSAKNTWLQGGSRHP